MSTEAKKEKEVIQLGVAYLQSRKLKSVIRSYHNKMDRSEIEKQWKAANKEK